MHTSHNEFYLWWWQPSGVRIAVKTISRILKPLWKGGCQEGGRRGRGSGGGGGGGGGSGGGGGRRGGSGGGGGRGGGEGLKTNYN